MGIGEVLFAFGLAIVICSWQNKFERLEENKTKRLEELESRVQELERGRGGR